MILLNVLQTIFILLGIILVLIALVALILKKKPPTTNLQLTHYNAKLKEQILGCQKQILEKKDLKKLLSEKKSENKAKNKKNPLPKLFVLDFKGDVQASQVQALKQQINVLLNILTDKDDVFLRLESGGGTVVGYGLASAHLVRLKEKARRFVIGVDKVAASGGYMMAATGHEVIAAPFAIIGSIGVITQIPNLNRFLKNKDIDFYEFTAGKYKRTVTTLGEVTEQGKEKLRDQLGSIHNLFKGFLQVQRPQLDMETVGTGEYWFGTDALDLKLIDKLCTTDEYLLEHLETRDIYVFQNAEEKGWLKKMLKMWEPAQSLMLRDRVWSGEKI